jgi:hypothetical protein
MTATLLLIDETKRARLRLQNVAPTEVSLRKTEPVAGCNCDRWGHPCPACVNHAIVPEAETSVSSPVKQ